MVEKKYVWEFTNQKKLTKKEFISYFERKVFSTIRKYGMLSGKSVKSREVVVFDDKTINSRVLAYILEKKFKVRLVSKNSKNVFRSYDLSDVAEMIFLDVLKGKFGSDDLKLDKLRAPLGRLLDREVRLYADLNGIKGTKKKRDDGISKLFSKFKINNPDLEQNVVKAFEQVVD